MNKKKNRENMEEKLLFDHLDTEASAFADGRSGDARAESKYKNMEAKLPTGKVVNDLRVRVSLAGGKWLSASAQALAQYSVWRACMTGAVATDVKGIVIETRTRVKEQLETLRNLTGRGFQHLSLVPDPSVFSHTVLDGGACIQTPNMVPEPGIGPMESVSDNHYVVVMNRNEQYAISLDAADTLTGSLEIGDEMIRVLMDKPLNPRPEITVYVNGIGDPYLREITWINDVSFMISHEFDHPEFTNLSILTSNNQIVLVVWNCIELKLINSIIRQMIPEERDRFVWWYTPVAELDRLTPWQCMQLRREHMVIAWLRDNFDLKELNTLA